MSLNQHIGRTEEQYSYLARTLKVVALIGALVLTTCVATAMFYTIAQALNLRKAYAIRAALGAGKQDAIRSILSNVLGTAILTVGVALLSAYGFSLMLAQVLPGLPFQPADLRFGLLSALAFCLSGVLCFFSSWPSVRILLGADLISQLRLETTSDDPRSGFRAGPLLVFLQFSIAVVLAVHALAFSSSLQNRLSIPLGMEVDHVVVGWVDWRLGSYTAPQRAEFISELKRVIESSNGTTALAVSIPLSGSKQQASVSTSNLTPVQRSALAIQNQVSPEYFEVLGVEVLAGRIFSDSSAPTNQREAVISESLAERLWPGQSPLGKTFTLQENLEIGRSPVSEVVGVVRDHIAGSLYEREPEALFTPINSQAVPRTIAFMIKTRQSSAHVIEEIRDGIHGLESPAPILNLQTLAELRDKYFSFASPLSRLLNMLSASALLICAIGAFMITKHRLIRLSHGIAVRVALGASFTSMIQFCLGAFSWVFLAGSLAAIGVLAISARTVNHQLYGTELLQDYRLASGILLVLFSTVAAVVGPSWRVLMAQPAAALLSGKRT